MRPIHQRIFERQPQQGFTILELLMAVSVLAITLAIAVPSFSTMIRTNRLAASVNSLVTAMNYARSEAYKRGVIVRVCASNSANSECSGSSTWTNGWLVIADTNNNSTVSVANGDTVIQTFSAPEGGFTYSANGRFFSFRQLGIETAPAGAATTVEIYKNGCTGLEKRTITLAPTGRISLAKVAC